MFVLWWYAAHCTVHASLAALEFKYKYKAASENPPHDFSSKFCTKHMLNVYAAKYGELGSERESTRGSKRLSNVLDILQNDGAKREAMMGKQVLDHPFCITSIFIYGLILCLGLYN